MLRTMPMALRRTSMSALRGKGDKLDRKSAYGEQSAHLDRTCSRSMTSPSMTGPCLERRFSIRSRTISLTLLSDSLTTRLIRQEAAAAGDGINQIQSYSETLNTFDCGRVLSQGCQGCCSLVFNRMRWRVQQFQDAANPACLRWRHVRRGSKEREREVPRTRCAESLLQSSLMTSTMLIWSASSKLGIES